MRVYRTVRLTAISILLCMSPEVALLAQPAVTAPASLQIMDTPNDGGESLTLVWSPSPSDGPEAQYEVLIGAPGATDSASFKIIAQFPANTRYVKQAKSAWWTRAGDPTWHQYVIKNGKGVELKDGTTYPVTVAMRKGAERSVGPLLQAASHPNWFNWNQINNLILALGFGALVFYTISHAKRNEIFLRRIPGLDAVDEAIGRSTELGKPILYLTGAHDMSDPSTIAAAGILGRVAKRTASYETEVMGPPRDPSTMAVCQGNTKQA